MTETYRSPSNILPHSYPFIFIDRIIDIEKGKGIVCIKNVTYNEDVLQEYHMPNTLIIEAMAQASGLIIGNEKTIAYLAGIRNARFNRYAIPGDQLVIKSSLIHSLHPLYVFEVRVSVKEETVSEAEITLTVV